LETKFDPSQFPEWEIFQKYMYVHPDSFVYEGLRNRLKPRKKEENTDAKNAWMPKVRKKLKKLNKVFCFLDGSQSPIVAPPRANTDGPDGSTNFSLCQIVDENSGNQTRKKTTNLPENNEVVRTLCDGRCFLIQDKQPASVDSDSLETNFDPSQFPDWEIFQKYMYVHPDSFVYEGLRHRLKPGTDAKKAWKPKVPKKLQKLNKVYCFLDGSQSPIVARPRASKKGPDGSTNFSLCQIVDG
jgi:hypothetical protein